MPAAESTRAYYERHADAYADRSVGVSMLRYGRRFASLVPVGGRVLDLGSGSGRDLTMLREMGFRPVGLDYAGDLARRAERQSGCPVVVADMRELPFAADSFDGVWASASLLHLERREIGPALRECRRVLRPGGTFFATLKRGDGSDADGLGRHFTYYRTQEWRTLLRDAGFTAASVSAERRPATPMPAGRPFEAQPSGWLASLSHP